ncbi:hypothetical protein SAMN04490244_101279 [Tranquillimonas rosea]|uniref:Uncharacterized protein n=1 Tax=Tranquillimonas rosea TaxID=641238 RepID=A0A1H9PP96_9RHOB|nr:hypothetical protein [Tranquillimonas rosea]SER50156.1 hypothetical protein SAMN04490244_101279 [Tranquillimonas rosea]
MYGMHIRITALAGEDFEPEFYVMVIETEGASICLWHGTSYERAILEAERGREDFGPVIDQVIETYPDEMLREL